ncbi:hypothetical protein E143388_08338 [Rhodococcus opacus]|nr:hypothetical protein E143388_08338 [Rhodococcus opacus]
MGFPKRVSIQPRRGLAVRYIENWRRTGAPVIAS